MQRDSATAEFPGMPRAAIETGSVDWVMSSDTIGRKLVELVMEADSTAEWLTNSR